MHWQKLRVISIKFSPVKFEIIKSDVIKFINTTIILKHIRIE